MAKKINVSIPDKLFARLERFRDRLAISKICQEAIERAIELQEVATKDIPEKTRFIMRLQKEMDETSVVWRDTGFKHGIEDATQLHLKDFEFITKVFTSLVFPEDKRDYAYVLKSINYLKENPIIINRIDKMEAESLDNFFNADIYIEGWVCGVMRIWDSIRDEVLIARKRGGNPMEEES